MALGAVALGAVVDLLAIRADLDQGRRQLDQLDLDTLRSQGLEGALDRAADSLDSAADRAASSPFLRLVGAVPVLDDQVHAIRDLTGAADELGGEARITGARVAAAIERAGEAPGARIELLDVVSEELDRVQDVATRIDIGAGGALLPPLRAARNDVGDALASVPERLAPLRLQVAALRDLLAGPSSYLVVVGNNAEMRAGAGMPLSAGLAAIAGGEIDLGSFESTVSELYAREPTGPYNSQVPAILRRTYPRWNLGRDFAETSVIPHFPVTAPMYADIAADTQGWRVDGVLHIDAMALAELLAVVGPVEIDGTLFTAETAPQLVLNQPYIDYDSLSERPDRLEAQSQLANALFDAVEDREVDLLDVVAALQRSAEGRHLMAWSRDPVLQDLFRSFGAAGAVGPAETLVSFQNTGANKLDWYIEPTVAAEVEPLEDEWLVTLEATVPNPADIVTSDYIDGTLRGLEGGTHRVLVTAQTPAHATDLFIDSHPVTEHGSDGVSKVIGTRVTIPRGESSTVTIRYRLPAEARALRVVPSARVRPVPWTVNGRSYDDDVRFVAPLGRFPEPAAARAMAASWAAVLVALVALGFLAAGARTAAPSARAIRMARVDTTTGAVLFVIAFVLGVAGALLG